MPKKISDGMPYALEMLGLVLDGTDSSRYSRKLQRGDAVALDTSAGYTDFGHKNAIFSPALWQDLWGSFYL